MLFRVFTVLAVVALAISTWILSTPGRMTKPAAPTLGAARPGYYLKDAVLTDYAQNGNPAIKIAAGRIDQVGTGTEVALHDIRVDYQAPGGQAWVMVGDLAHVQPGGKAVDVTGNVRLQGVDPGRAGTAVIRTDRMTYDVADAVVHTASDVRIDFAAQSLTARGLVANLNKHTIRLESQVNGTFRP